MAAISLRLWLWGTALLAMIGVAWHMAYAEDPLKVARHPLSADPMTQAGQAELEQRKGRRHVPSPIIFPDQHLPLRFSHKIHSPLLDCVDCHQSIPESVRASDVNLPKESVCTDCHDIEAAAKGDVTALPSTCTTCHPGYEPRWNEGVNPHSSTVVNPPAKPFITEPRIKFNHKQHLQQGLSCTTCHSEVAQVDLATRENALPLMQTCVNCHDGQQAANQCKTCHITEPGGRLQTQFNEGKLVPAGWYFFDAHDDRWLSNHRHVAALGSKSCEACHSQKECVDCHNGVSKPLRIHPNNFVLQHASAARRNDPDCSSCHRSQTFCVDCHQSTGVALEVPSRLDRRLRFHPEGWVEYAQTGEIAIGKRSPNHHGFQAQRNIRTCASCHLESTCISCHASSELGGRLNGSVSPHGRQFIQSGDCVRMRNKNERACYKCHSPMAREMRCE